MNRTFGPDDGQIEGGKEESQSGKEDENLFESGSLTMISGLYPPI